MSVHASQSTHHDYHQHFVFIRSLYPDFPQRFQFYFYIIAIQQIILTFPFGHIISIPFVLNKEDKDSIWVLLCQMIIKRDMYLQGEGESINEVVGGTVVPIVRFRIGTCRRDGVTIIRVVSK